MSQNQTEGFPVGMAAPAAARRDTRSVESFDASRAVRDEISRYCPADYLPVSFVAKDWKVSTRRIRTLLAAGRLAGRLQENGYWEVLYPYQFIFGKRGPSLKRQERPKKPERRAE